MTAVKKTTSGDDLPGRPCGKGDWGTVLITEGKYAGHNAYYDDDKGESALVFVVAPDEGSPHFVPRRWLRRIDGVIHFRTSAFVVRTKRMSRDMPDELLELGNEPD